MNIPVSFEPAQFDRIFPFYILIDEQLGIISSGKTIQKILPWIGRNKFTDSFSIKRPESTITDFSKLKTLVNQLILIECNCEHKTVLRGQFELVAGNTQLLFIGSPWFGSMEQVISNNLRLDDFAIHDPLIDLLHIVKAQEITTADLKKLLLTVNEQKKQLVILSSIAAQNTNGVVIADREGRIEWINKSFETMSGYTIGELKGKKPGQILQGKDTDPETIAYLRNQINKGEPFVCEILNYHKSGTPYWLRLLGQALKDRDGNVINYFSIEEDITKKKLSEENLRNSENRLSTLIRNLKEGILLEDENRRIVITNENFCRMFNIPVDPILLTGADCSQSSDQAKHLFKDPEEFVTRIDQILQEKKMVLSEELELVSGKYYERDYIPIIIDENSKGHLWKYTDITERKIQERILKQKEEKYRNIIANMKMGLLETDNNDIISYANQQFSEMTGYQMQEILGKRSIDLLVPEVYKQLVNEKLNARNESIPDTYELPVRIRSGEDRWWLTSGGPNYNDKGELIGTIGISVDITEQKVLEEELIVARKKAEESSNAKESFLANMSHEIRTPLNAIIGMIREISREPLTQKQTLYIRNAGLACQHLLSIVNDILDLTKIESGQLTIEYHPFSLNQIIDNVISILSPAAGDKMLQLVANFSGELEPAYMGDSNRIKQVLLNIVNNAIKFTDQGKITVDCQVIAKEDKTDRIRLKVTDTGIGMDKEFLDHVFDKFSQGEISTARKYGGTGLGLAITRELVQLMNGKIHIKSKKGTGTTVEVLLDLEPGDEATIETVSTPDNLHILKNINILLVEDNDLNRLVARNALLNYGIHVTEATNGAEAIEKLKETPFDLILIDLQMPVMDGISATKIIREKMKLRTPVIAITANAFKAERDRCFAAGMNDYITKPFEENTLLGGILRNLSTSDVSPLSTPTGLQSSEKSYNLDYIVQFSRGNPAFVEKMIRLFIEQMPVAVNEIKTALKELDPETISKTAHRIKPNIDNFGITDLKQDIRKIESMAKKGTITSELDSLIERLEIVITRVVRELENEVH